MITTLARTAAALNAILLNINSAGVGSIRLWTAPIPADLATAPTGTLIVNAPLQSSAGAAFTNATTTAPPTATANTGGTPARVAYTGSITATGTVAFFRVYDQAGTAVLQGTVGISAGTGEMVITPSLDLIAGGTFSVNSMTVALSGTY
jgi:hypothetical protein